MKRMLAIFMAAAMMTSALPVAVLAEVPAAESGTEEQNENSEKSTTEASMTLDIPELQILKNGTVSYDTFGVDTEERDFRLGEVLTLTLNEGFAFVETEIHDHDKTTLQNVEWIADEDGEIRTVKVPVYKEEDSGFDMEGMTIQATTAEIGEEALLTVSAEAYPSVSQVIAVVVKEITENPDEEEDAETDTVMFTIGTREYTVNGKTLEMEERIPATWLKDEKYVMIPFRAAGTILQELDDSAEMLFDTEKQTVIFTYNDETVEMTIGSDTAVVNGKNVTMETACVMNGDYAFVPMKELFAAFGAEDWVLDGEDGRFHMPELESDTSGEVHATAKVADCLELEEEAVGALEEDYVIPAKDAPELQIRITDAEYKNGSEPVGELELNFEKASFENLAGGSQKELEAALCELVTIHLADTEEPRDTIAWEVLEYNSRYDQVVFEISGALQEGDVIIIDLPLQLVSPLRAGYEMTVSIDGDLLTSEEMAFVTIVGDSLEITPGGKLEINADEKVSILKNGSAMLDTITIEAADEFDYNEDITVKLNKGFIFGDTDGITVQGGSFAGMEGEDEIIFRADKKADQLVIDGIVIEAATAEKDDTAILYVEHSGYETAKTEVAVVAVKGRLVLDIPKQTVKNGGKAVYDVFGIDKTDGDVFAEGDRVTLTLSEGFAFMKGSVYDHDGTEIEVAEWSNNKVVLLAPEDPQHGFDMEGMVIHATSAKPGETAVVTASVDGYESVSREVLTVEKKNGGNNGNSSNKNNNNKNNNKKEDKTETPAENKTEAPTENKTESAQTPEAPKVTVTESAVQTGETAADTAPRQTVQAVAQETKQAYHEQLSRNEPSVEVVGSGAFTFAVTATETTEQAEAPAESMETTTESAQTAPETDTAADTVASSVSSAKDPEKVSFDLSEQNIADTAHLTLVKYVTQPDGTVEVVKLGGAFDPETNTFSAYADGEGVYDLVHDPDVTKLTFAIGQQEVSMNDEVKTNDVAPILHENRTMVPLRSIAEALGADVTWNEAEKTVQITQGGQTLTLAVGNEDGTAMILNDRTMVQLRYIGETFGASVRWIPGTQSIEIVK